MRMVLYILHLAPSSHLRADALTTVVLLTKKKRLGRFLWGTFFFEVTGRAFFSFKLVVAP